MRVRAVAAWLAIVPLFVSELRLIVLLAPAAMLYVPFIVFGPAAPVRLRTLGEV